MKVKIGKYPRWVGPYQVADFLHKYFFLPESFTDKIAETLPVEPFEWFRKTFQRGGEQKVYVKIEDHDTWNADQTMAYIILPILKRLQNGKQGTPFTDPDDAPEHLRPPKDEVKENEWDTDSKFEARWEYILGEMIFAFESIINEGDIEDTYFSNKYKTFDKEGFQKHTDRVNNGLRLFGRYYRGLWT
jgi:hypothetical protein